MAKRLTAVELLELKGAYRKDPQRRRPPAPKAAEEVGEAPGTLPESAREIWAELVELAPPGVLTKSDRPMVELAAKLLDEFRNCDGEFITSRVARLESILSRLGLSPTDRARVAVPVKSEPNEFADL